MHYRRLGYFVAVAEELSFTRAAQRLHMAQPPLSQQIALLEKDVGAVLFDRSRRSVRLTAAGAALLPEARRLLADLDATARMVRRVGAGAVGRLALGFVPSAVNGPLPDLIRRFRQHHPDAELVLRELAPDPLLAAVHDGRVELGVLYRPVAREGLEQRLLATERLVLALPAGHPAARLDEVPLAAVADEPFVLPEQHDVPGLHAAVSAAFVEAGIAPRVAQRGVWLVQTVLALVAAGIGLAVVPSSAQVASRRDVVLRPVRAPHNVELVAVWRHDHDSALLDNALALIDGSAPKPMGRPVRHAPMPRAAPRPG